MHQGIGSRFAAIVADIYLYITADAMLDLQTPYLIVAIQKAVEHVKSNGRTVFASILYAVEAISGRKRAVGCESVTEFAAKLHVAGAFWADAVRSNKSTVKQTHSELATLLKVYAGLPLP